MTGPGTAAWSAGPQALREVRRDVAGADDDQVLRVVRMVDALAVRGETDAVLAPVRTRLRAIRPAHPLRFARLVFMPADPLIVMPGAWRAGTPFLPRHALTVLGAALRDLMGGADAPARIRSALATADALIVGADTSHADVVRRAGHVLWPEAAKAMRLLGNQAALSPAPARLAACHADWAAQGLPSAELSPIALSVSALLGAAWRLYECEHGGVALTEGEAAGMLAAAAALGQRPGAMMLGLLMIRAPQFGVALLKAVRSDTALREQAGAAMETAIVWAEAETAGQPGIVTPDAAAALGRQVGLLQILEAEAGDSLQRRHAAQFRETLLERSLGRLETSLRDNIAVPLQSLPEAPGERDAALDTMEAQARQLRGFELEARKLGGAPRFDALSREASAWVDTALTGMDKARLLELLLGTEAATRIL